MNKNKRCEIVKDLLPLYADDMCSDSSRNFVKEHLKECGGCRKELEDYRYNIGIPDTDEEKEAFASFSKKLKKRNFVKIVVSVLLSLALVASAYYVLFVPEYVVPYSDELLEAKIPVDKGVDVWVNLDNYFYVQSWDLRDEEGNYVVWDTEANAPMSTVLGQQAMASDHPELDMQTNFTRLFNDSDKTDHLWRIGASNEMGWCAQSNKISPVSGENPKVKNIYYLVMHPDEVSKMVDVISFEDYETHLIWSAQDVER